MTQASDEIYRFRKWAIPARMMPAISHYINEGRPVGHFLRALICHDDVFRVIGYADDDNVENLPAFCAYFHNEAPAQCHGSAEAYKAWIEKYKPRE